MIIPNAYCIRVVEWSSSQWTCWVPAGSGCAYYQQLFREWWDFPMPLTRLIRPWHPKNLSVNHLYPIEFKPVWVTSASFNKLSHDFHSSNWGLSQLPTLYNSFNKIVGLYPNNCVLSQLPTLCNSFNKIVGLYQGSPPGFHYLTSRNQGLLLAGLEPATSQLFSSAAFKGI